MLRFLFCSFLISFGQAKSADQQLADSRIVGGQAASSGQFPYQGFMITVVGSNSFSCGCSLIATNWALTAAHCTGQATSITVAFGIIDQSSLSSSSISVIAYSNHPDYNSATLQNDISLLKLSTHVQTSALISPIALPTSGESVPTGTSCLISGFGTTSESNSQISNSLQYASVPIVSFSDCAAVYSNVIESPHICAGYASGGIDSCRGDSGGPLACPSSSGQLILQGLTSFGIGCARLGIPGVYTRVSTYIVWIESTMQSSTLISLATLGSTSGSSKITHSYATCIIPFVLILIAHFYYNF